MYILPFGYSASQHKNRPGFRCGNRGGSFALWVFIRAFQAPTPSLAGIFDGSLSGSQNYRAFGVTTHRGFQFFS
jgi:hypothetical protein